MKVGVLWSDGTVSKKVSVFDAMYSFINGRRLALALQNEVARPVRLVRKIEVSWEPLEPSREQIHKCLQAVTTWEQYNQHERPLR